MASQQLATLPESHSADTDKQRRNLLRQWLVRFALNAGQPLDGKAQDVYVSLWLESFAVLSDAILEAAFRKTLATCKFWPVKIADVREHVDSAESKAFRLESEGEWEKLLAWVSENFLPDGRTLPNGGTSFIRKGASRLPAAVEHAARAAGGFHFLESCTREQLIWAKKDFLAALANVHETGQSQHLIGNSEAKQILARLSAPPPLLVPKPAAQEPEVPLPSRQEVRSVLNKIADLPSEEEWQARKTEQKDRLAKWISEHPEHAGTTP